MTWPIHVINMAANTTRMDRVTRELDDLNLPFQRFEAVVGAALSDDDWRKVYDAKANLRRARHPMIGPELGCYLSHLELWKEIAAGDTPGAIILEDDFTAAPDLPEVLAALEQDTAPWDIAKLFSARAKQKTLDRRPLTATREIGVPYKVPNTTLGYAIRRDAAARLATKALPVSRPIDEDHKHFWEWDLRVALVTPPPLAFGEQSAETGTITAARTRTSGLSTGATASQAWRTLRFRLNYLVKLHWNRFVCRAR